jgi:hypothetical protein
MEWISYRITLRHFFPASAFRDGEAAFPVVDAAALHVDAIVARACA